MNKTVAVFFISVLSLFLSCDLYAQEEIGIECIDCSDPTLKAMQVAAQMNLATDDRVNVIDTHNGTIDSFTIIRTVIRRSGNVVYIAPSIQTAVNVQNAFDDLVIEVNKERVRIQNSVDTDIASIDNPCVLAGPGGGVFTKATSVWDFVGCEPAQNFLEENLVKDIGFYPSVLLKVSNMASQFTSPVNLNIPIAIELFTSDGGKLHFDLVYNIISGDEVIISAEFNEERSRDGLGNSLSAPSGEGGQTQATYFTGNGNQEIRAAALLAFIQAAQRLGLLVEMGGSLGGPIQTKCVPKPEGGFRCSPI